MDCLSALRRKIAGIEGRPSVTGAERTPLGHEGIDHALGGGLTRGRLHEVFAIDPDDASSAAGFAAMLALRLGGPLLWLRAEAAEACGGALYIPGLCEIGVDPADLILGVLPNTLAVLRAAADVARSPNVGTAVIELWQSPRLLDLTATRRLALAAEASGVTLLLLRTDAEPAPSAAHTRWTVRAAASTPMEADAPGHPAFEIELLRQRTGPAGRAWLVEWDREQTIFRDQRTGIAALSGAVVPLSSCRPADADILSPLRRAG